MKKKVIGILIAAVAITVFDIIVGAATCGGVFSWVYEIEPVNVDKPIEGAPPMCFLIGTFVMNVIFALVYMLICKGVPGKNSLIKGLVYGLCVWAARNAGDTCFYDSRNTGSCLLDGHRACYYAH